MMASASSSKSESNLSPRLGRRQLPPKLPSEASPVIARRTYQSAAPTFQRTSSLEMTRDVSPPSSPTVGRKARGDNVFSRLTSRSASLSETNRDRGMILPYNGRMKSAPLYCTHVAEGHSKAVLSVAATDEMLFSASKDRTVKVWDLHKTIEVQSLENHPNNVTVVKYSPKTKLVFSVSASYVKVWDIREKSTKCIKTLSSMGLITHATASLSSGTSRSNVGPNGKEQQINDIVLNENGSTLFSASGNIVRMWDLRKFLCIGKLNGGHQAAVMCLALKDYKDHCFVMSGSKDHYIKVFEVKDGIGGMRTPLMNLEPPHYDGVESFSVTDRYLFSGSRDMSIKKWDLNEYELKQSVNQAHKDWICGLDVLPGGQVLLSGCRGGYLKLWSVDNCAQLGEIKAHANPINSLATNSSLVFSASSDNTIGIWKMKSLSDSVEYGNFS